MDIHTHAVASGHAYSTVDENLRWAAEQGLQLVALTDHAPAMKDTTCHAYFANLHVLPKELHGVRLLKGIELNILDFDGTIDMDEAVLQRLDLAIASLHMPCIKPGTKKENTQVIGDGKSLCGHHRTPRRPSLCGGLSGAVPHGERNRHASGNQQRFFNTGRLSRGQQGEY